MYLKRIWCEGIIEKCPLYERGVSLLKISTRWGPELMRRLYNIRYGILPIGWLNSLVKQEIEKASESERNNVNNSGSAHVGILKSRILGDWATGRHGRLCMVACHTHINIIQHFPFFCFTYKLQIRIRIRIMRKLPTERILQFRIRIWIRHLCEQMRVLLQIRIRMWILSNWESTSYSNSIPNGTIIEKLRVSSNSSSNSNLTTEQFELQIRIKICR